nr:Gag-Pol polyprotein [Tanacetum cinerariifolium]
MQQPIPNPEDITDPTTAMNMALALMAKAFKLNYSTPTNNNQRISSNPRNRQIAQPGMNMGQDRQMQMIRVQNVRNQAAQKPRVQNDGIQNQGSRTFCSRLHCQGKEKGCCLSSDTVADCSEGRGRNPTLSRGQASSSGTQIDSTPVYDSDGSAEAHENCNNNEIFNMFTQEEQYTELLKPIHESQQVPQNDNNVIYKKVSSLCSRI